MAKPKVMKGKDFMVFVNNKATALATSHKLTLNAETSDAASKDEGMWDESIVSKMSWEASTEALVSADANVDSYDALYDLFVAGEAVTLVCGVPLNLSNDGVPEGGWAAPSTNYYTGSALITNLDRNDQSGSNSTMSISFRGVGKLERKKA